MKYIPILVILPLFSAFLAPAAGLINKRFGRYFNLLIYAGGLIFSFMVLPDGLIGGHSIIIGGWRPPFGINLYFGPVSGIGFVVIYFLAFLIHLSDLTEARSNYYNLLFSMFVFSSLGMVVTGDLFNLFIFLEIGSVAVVALASSVSERAGTRGSVKYMVPSNLVAMFMLIGIALIYSTLGTLNIAHITSGSALNAPYALVIGLAIFTALFFESELFPFNTWVPDVYKGAASSFSGALSGIGGFAAAVVLGRIFLTMMGPESSFKSANASLSAIVMIVGIASLLVGELSALKEKDLKKVLAFSSIGQMGLVAIAFSTQNALAVTAGIILLLNHSIAKPIMLVTSGLFIKSTGKTKWCDMRGVARLYPMIGVIFIVSALSLMGMPFFMGFWGKLELVKSLIDGNLLSKVALGAILFSVIIEGTYFVRLSHAFFEQPEGDKFKAISKLQVLVPALIMIAAIVVFGLYPNYLHSLTGKISQDLLDSAAYINNILHTVSSAGVGL